MFTFRATLNNGSIKFIDNIPLQYLEEKEYSILVTFLDQDLENELFEEERKMGVIERLNALALRLSEREIEVLRLAQQGFTNEKIADRLEIGHGTVRNYLSSVYGKLRVENRTSAIAKAVELGLLE